MGAGKQREEMAIQIAVNFLRGLETLLGFLSILTTGMLAIIATLFVCFDKTPDSAVGPLFIVLLLAVMLPGLIVESVLLCALIDKLRLGWKPLPLFFALNTPRLPLVLRPVVGLWWTAHFLLGTAIALKIETGLPSVAGDYSIQIQIVVFFAISFSLAFAFNLYAMLALAAFGFGERFIRAAWKWRVTIDFVIAIAAMVLPMKSDHPQRRFMPRPLQPGAAGHLNWNRKM